MKDSAIAWTHHTFNGWWGCTEVSPGCDNCYARELSKRFTRAEWGHGKERWRTSPAYWAEPLKWAADAAARGVREQVFAHSMSDVNDISAPQEWKDDLWNLIRETRHSLDWLLLSKRPWRWQSVPRDLDGEEGLWLGASVENQDYMWRAEQLCERMDAVVKFVSAEPLIGPLEFDDRYLGGGSINWVIAGCESGPGKRAGKRAMDLEWVRSLRDQCESVGNAAFFYKQGVVDGRVVELPYLDGRQHAQMPIFGEDRKYVSKLA